MGNSELVFGSNSPIDQEERQVVLSVFEAIKGSEDPHVDELVSAIQSNIALLDRLGGVFSEYPSPFATQSLGRRKRDLESLVDLLSQSAPSNLEMFLPTRALIGRILVMAEMNFYRLLRKVCDQAITGPNGPNLKAGVDRRLCICLYTKLTEEVLSDIVSDADLSIEVRERAALALSEIWEHNLTYRLRDFFPLLEMTWEARRRVRVTFGTLVGVSEMFALMREGCDQRFVEFFTRPEQPDETEAFREFLFGASTEQLVRMEQKLAEGKSSIDPGKLSDGDRLPDFSTRRGDPASLMYEFFLSRHLQASARRQANIPGPKRTAEEYVMIYFLQNRPAKVND
jgi:hypothetical protein